MGNDLVLTGLQARDLVEAFAHNAGGLLADAEALLSRGSEKRARALAVLALEEARKGVLVHRLRRAFTDDETVTITADLQQVWRSGHRQKLQAVHGFLVENQYWFAVEEPEPHPLLLGPMEKFDATFKTWARADNRLKQAGFYVDVASDGAITSPMSALSSDDRQSLEDMITAGHEAIQQLHLGAHIEWKSHRMTEQIEAMPPFPPELQTIFASGRRKATSPPTSSGSSGVHQGGVRTGPVKAPA